MLFSIAVVVGLVLYPMWIVFEKMGRKGWEGIIPIYNVYVMLKIAGRASWLIILFLIPIVNIGIWILACHGVAKGFGKEDMFALIMSFFPIIGFPLLAYRSSEKFDASAVK